jgi:hypothetical protein
MYERLDSYDLYATNFQIDIKRTSYSDSPRPLRILHITRALIQVFQTFVATWAILLSCRISAGIVLNRTMFYLCILALVDIGMHPDAIVRRHTLRPRLVKPDLWRDNLAASRRCSGWRVCRKNLT